MAVSCNIAVCTTASKLSIRNTDRPKELNGIAKCGLTTHVAASAEQSDRQSCLSAVQISALHLNMNSEKLRFGNIVLRRAAQY